MVSVMYWNKFLSEISIICIRPWWNIFTVTFKPQNSVTQKLPKLFLYAVDFRWMNDLAVCSWNNKRTSRVFTGAGCANFRRRYETGLVSYCASWKNCSAAWTDSQRPGLSSCSDSHWNRRRCVHCSCQLPHWSVCMTSALIRLYSYGLFRLSYFFLVICWNHCK